MPKKKKGKGGKLARMNEEERARYLQYRAELELEARRRKQQLIAVFTKNKLKREEAFSRLNTAKINEQWRFILRRIKCKELHEDVKYLWENFDRTIKEKDLVIQRLHNELEAADVDHRRLQEAHIRMIDLIIGKYKQKCTHFHESFTRESDRIASNEMYELNRTRKDLEQYYLQTQNIILGQDKEIEDRLMQKKIQNAVNIHNIIYLKEDSLSRLIQYASKKVEELWKQLNETITEYENTTGDKRKQHEYLKEQDNVHRMDVVQYLKLHTQLQNTITNLKQNLHTLSEKRGRSIKELKDQTVRMNKKIEDLRQESSMAQMLDAMQLKKLTIISSSVLKELQRISEKSSALLSLLKMCSSLEPCSLILKKYILRDTDSNRASTNCVPEPFNKLEEFWEKFNYVKAENISTKREYNKLIFENKQLRSTLRTYLITISGTPTARPLMSIPV